MKTVILAGGFGTRISEESHIKPKPMIEIGGKPILWHIMKIYSAHGINDFIICLGYKGYVIKEYFANYFLHMSDVTFDMCNNNMEVHNNHSEPWKITLIDTGADTMTGGRLKRAKDFLDSETFCFTYGDGVSDINISKLIEFHKSKNAVATMTAVQPPGRFGVLSIDGTKIRAFQEKPKGESGWVNGGFFVFEPKIFDYIDNDHTTWEKEPLECLAAENKLHAFKHTGFWYAMDTLRDKIKLEEYWNTDSPPWKIW
jgi:glucose-1-phosphate cytidylyltransferase